MAQFRKKEVYFETNAEKEIKALPEYILGELDRYLLELSEFGFLKYPNGRKLNNYDLFEIRIHLRGAWRFLYAYRKNGIVVLCAFQKKEQKTSIKHIKTALKRLKKLK